MGASRSSTAALRTPCLTTHLIFAMKDRGTRKKSEGSSPHLLPSPGKRVGENDSFLSRPFWPCLDYSCRIVDSRNSLSLLLKHAKKIFLLFLYNSTYVLFWPPANQRESWKLDGSYFKSSDLTSTLLLGLCLSFWDINCTDIGVGQLCGLSLWVCQSFSCVQLLQPRGLYPTRLPCPWNSPSKNTRVGCRLFLQGIFPTQESNPGLVHCRQIIYHLSHQGLSLPPCFLTTSAHGDMSIFHVVLCQQWQHRKPHGFLEGYRSLFLIN